MLGTQYPAEAGSGLRSSATQPSYFVRPRAIVSTVHSIGSLYLYVDAHCERILNDNLEGRARSLLRFLSFLPSGIRLPFTVFHFQHR